MMIRIDFNSNLLQKDEFLFLVNTVYHSANHCLFSILKPEVADVADPEKWIGCLAFDVELVFNADALDDFE